MSSIYSNESGRFTGLHREPLYAAEGWPNVYGQTRVLAERLGGTIVDLAGGCIGVRLPDGRLCGIDDECGFVAYWIETADGDILEQTTEPFEPFTS